MNKDFMVMILVDVSTVQVAWVFRSEDKANISHVYRRLKEEGTRSETNASLVIGF